MQYSEIHIDIHIYRQMYTHTHIYMLQTNKQMFDQQSFYQMLILYQA